MVSREQRVEATLVTPGMPLREAIGVLDVAGTGLLLLSSGGGILEAVLTDGDIRRHILAGGGLDVLTGLLPYEVARLPQCPFQVPRVFLDIAAQLRGLAV